MADKKNTTDFVSVETDDGIVEVPLSSTETSSTETSNSILVKTDDGIVEVPLSWLGRAANGPPMAYWPLPRGFGEGAL
ncbi:hypothetical protein OG417_14565 [Actinoallomurus sp. NBC_01490]|uniref:hypothetical protein n=1 Tax=Actinoallomurus sp. NBC_01490 TaxID=2903557 RepID=UPI002E33E33A|nr:hypothetical protein [Actinoallomurus sp. NBC_01490]